MGFLKKILKLAKKSVLGFTRLTTDPLGIARSLDISPMGAIERRIKQRKDAAQQEQVAKDAALKQEQANAATGNAARLGLFSNTDAATVQTNTEAQALIDTQTPQTPQTLLDAAKRKKLTSRLGII